MNSEILLKLRCAEGKGDHRHIRGKTEPYKFVSLRKLANDFYRDIERYKRGEI